ncbi:cytochrome P450 [Sulfitobacter sp. S190]|uniref:cytochrome P450 n=1 Tax=Sulfitobacter sp. S190 TaxID=2867022 RepID=UPI0021A31326|nr:cytochrome P450 [Sulfitobacter sp. S190]UWR22933.1 cytochrome P450 [Sulfitobacter sp. S190]
MKTEAAPPMYPVCVPLLHDEIGMMRSLAMVRDNVLSIIPDAALDAPILSGRTGKRWHMVMDPPAIRQILLERLDNYPKSDVTKNLLAPAIGESLFIAEGSHWRWQRRAAAPAFSHRNVTALAPVMTAAAERTAQRIAATGPRAVNMLDEMVTATFDVIADVTFSDQASLDRSAVHRAIDAYIADAGKVGLLDVLGLPGWVPRPGRMKSARALEQTKQAADRAIEARHARGPGDVPDLLDLMLGASDPKTGREMSTQELRDNLLTFIVAGHETTALTLAWAFYLLGFDPDMQRRARDEAVGVLQGRAATAEDLPDLPIARMIIDETLRLYPAGGLISRTAQGPDTLAGTEIRPGDTVMVPIYALGRSRRLWEDPDAFRPERFADRKAIDRFAYLPFSDGPRVCIGASFALQEAVIILSTLLGQFEFTAVPGKTPVPRMIITLRPDGGVWMTARPLASDGSVAD